MKTTLPCIMLACTLLAGCRSNQGQFDIVKATYIHKYGVPVAKADWLERGQDGQTVILRRDGVTVTSTYAKGVLHGVTTYTYPNSSTIHTSEFYEKGALVSKKENYPSGVPMQEETFAQGSLANLTRWYEDGTPQATEFYQDQLLSSGEYRTANNIVESRVCNGQGTRFFRSNEGELTAKDTIQNGLLKERVTFFSNGDPSTITNYQSGEIHGTRLTFAKGGLPNTVEQWSHGMQEGITIVYQNGEKIAEVNYSKGKKHGSELRYLDGTILVEELYWKNDLMHGPRKLYVDGQAKTEWYHEGIIVSRPTYERMNLPKTHLN
jgi:antitoxin component YwqK of YwqJK toxin-antitoxin module